MHDISWDYSYIWHSSCCRCLLHAACTILDLLLPCRKYSPGGWARVGPGVRWYSVCYVIDPIKSNHVSGGTTPRLPCCSGHGRLQQPAAEAAAASSCSSSTRQSRCRWQRYSASDDKIRRAPAPYLIVSRTDRRMALSSAHHYVLRYRHSQVEYKHTLESLRFYGYFRNAMFT